MSNRLLTKLPHVPNDLGSVLKRLTIWYTSPSGLLLAFALLLSSAFFIASGLTDSNWPAWLGLGSTAVLGLFLPYRFARQQGRTLGVATEALTATQALTTQHQRLESRLTAEANRLQRFKTRLNNQADRRQRLESRLNTEADRHQQLENRLTAEVDRFAKKNELFAQLEKRTGQHSTQISRLEEQFIAAQVADAEERAGGANVPARLLWLEQQNENAELRLEQQNANADIRIEQRLGQLESFAARDKRDRESGPQDIADLQLSLAALREEVGESVERDLVAGSQVDLSADQDLLRNLAAASVQRIWLASFPRSGNHWLRCLIEDVTDTVTGSAYPDTDPDGVTHIHSALGVLQARSHDATPQWWGAHATSGGYTGGRAQPLIGQTVFVKTHKPQFVSELDRLLAHGSVLLVRDPIDSITSFQRYQQTQGGQVTPFAELVERWVAFHEYWLSKGPTKIVHYDALQEDAALVLQSLFDSLGLDVSKEATQLAAQRYPAASAPDQERNDAEIYADVDMATRERLLRVREKLRQARSA